MASIYENALVTLAATYAIDINGGLFSTDQDCTPKQLSERRDMYVRERKKTSRLPLTYKHFSTSINSEHAREVPLLSRAWVYQRASTIATDHTLCSASYALGMQVLLPLRGLDY
jgi:hypothetical protein